MPNDTEAYDVDVRQYEGVRGTARLYAFLMLSTRRLRTHMAPMHTRLLRL
jgi:hypothetical protein